MVKECKEIFFLPFIIHFEIIDRVPRVIMNSSREIER